MPMMKLQQNFLGSLGLKTDWSNRTLAEKNPQIDKIIKRDRNKIKKRIKTLLLGTNGRQ